MDELKKVGTIIGLIDLVYIVGVSVYFQKRFTIFQNQFESLCKSHIQVQSDLNDTTNRLKSLQKKMSKLMGYYSVMAQVPQMKQALESASATLRPSSILKKKRKEVTFKNDRELNDYDLNDNEESSSESVL